MTKLGISEINNIIEHCKSMGYNLRVGDIVYIFALQGFKDKKVIYNALFGVGATAAEVEEYDTSKKMKALSKYLKTKYFKDMPVAGIGKEYRDISFEENKEALIMRLDDIREMAKNGELKKSDAMRYEIEIRTRLNDKFAVNDKQDDSKVVVLNKYNDICPYCRHEIRTKTDEDVINELKETYVLTPKSKIKEKKTNDREDKGTNTSIIG